MQDIKEFYILGQPIETQLGVCRFLKVKEYPEMFPYLNALAITKQHIIQSYYNAKAHEQVLDYLKSLTLFDIIQRTDELKQMYEILFDTIFTVNGYFKRMTNDDFPYYRKLVMDMNCIKEEIINPNPEIQRRIEASKRIKELETGKLEFCDIISSIVGFNGLDYYAVNDMTIFQLYMTFQRIAQIKGYDTSTLFATVSVDKINIESWCKHIDLLANEQYGISREEYNKLRQNVFGN